MKGLLFVSNGAFSGKTGIVLALGKKLQEGKKRVGYFKPYGWWPKQVEECLVDEDALYVAKTLGIQNDLGDLSPVFFHPERRQALLGEEEGEVKEIISKAYRSVGKGKDIVLVEGGAGFFEGEAFGVSSFRLAEALNFQVILIAKGEPILSLDDVLAASFLFASRLIGVIFNWVPLHSLDQSQEVREVCEKRGIRVFGFIPEDRKLLGVTIEELVNTLKGKILCCENKKSEIIETFMVGAMGQEKALRFFRRKRDKAVITGGDRADIQLAALETPTKCLILTGNFYPSPFVLSRAEELGVPVILVPDDTFTVVDKTEHLLGRVRVHEPEKVSRLLKLLKKHVNLDALFEVLGVGL